MMKQTLLNVLMMVSIAVDPMLILIIALNVLVMVGKHSKKLVAINVESVLLNGRAGSFEL